ncbi:MAG TPA: restriction endonuclease [Nitrososphaeraceae archaeon]
MLASIIRGIPYTGSVLEFQSLCGIMSCTTCFELLRVLNTNGIGKLKRGEVIFSAKDKLKLVHLAIQQNCNPKLLSQNLNWKDFESFVSVILQKIGYRCTANVHLTKPHMQIDVVATMGTKALLIDCKHWKNMGVSKMEECAKRQHMRTKSYLRTHTDIDYAIPIILTLNEPTRNFINKIPFVSISKFGSFLSNYDVCTNQLLQVWV